MFGRLFPNSHSYLTNFAGSKDILCTHARARVCVCFENCMNMHQLELKQLMEHILAIKQHTNQIKRKGSYVAIISAVKLNECAGILYMCAHVCVLKDQIMKLHF